MLYKADKAWQTTNFNNDGNLGDLQLLLEATLFRQKLGENEISVCTGHQC